MIPLLLSSPVQNEVLHRQGIGEFINYTGTGTIRNFTFDDNEVNHDAGIDYGRIIRAPGEQDAADGIIPSNGTFIANLTEFFWGAEITGIAQLAMDSRGLGQQQPEQEETEDERGLAVEYIYDRLDVRITFITLYSAVFACCFFGKWVE